MDWQAALAAFTGGVSGYAKSQHDNEERDRTSALDAESMANSRALRAMHQAAAQREATEGPLVHASNLAKLREAGVVPAAEARDTKFDLGRLMAAAGDDSGRAWALQGQSVPVATSSGRYVPLEAGSPYVQDEWNSPAAQHNAQTRLAEIARERLQRERLDTSTGNNVRTTTASRDNTAARVAGQTENTATRVGGQMGVAALRTAAGGTPGRAGTNQRTAYIGSRAAELQRGARGYGGRYSGGLSHDDAFAQAEADADRIYGRAQTQDAPQAARPAGAGLTPRVPMAAWDRGGDVDLGAPATTGISFAPSQSRGLAPSNAPNTPVQASDPVTAAVQRIRSGSVSLQQLEASGKSPEFKAAVKRQLGMR